MRRPKTGRTRPAAARRKAGFVSRELAPALWPKLERLFGQNGACGGCWCMWWRIRAKEKWEEVKGPEARQRFKKMVLAGEVRGILLFEGDEPIGWCTFGPRRSFPRLDRSPSLAIDDADRVWSIPCFYVKSTHRSRGAATALLRAALKAMRRDGAKTAEAYAVRPPQPGRSIPAVFAWTGTVPMFAAAGFVAAEKKARGKVRMRRAL